MTREPETEAERQQREAWEAALNDKAEKCLDQHPDNVRQAGLLMAAEVRADPRLQQAVLGILLEQSCLEWVRRQLQARNQRIWHRNPDVTQRSGRLKSAGLARLSLKMMDYTLMGGVPLREATREEVLKNARFQDKQARRMGQTALWLGLIADQMPEDLPVKVKEVFTEDDLRHLQSQVVGFYGEQKEHSPEEPTTVKA